jgi:uncharacterized membrane protein
MKLLRALSIRSEQFVVAGILLVAIALNLYHLNGQSLARDEVLQTDIGRSTFTEMNLRLAQDFVHPPLSFYFWHIWFQLVGVGALQTRLLSALFGAGSVVVMYFLARYLFGRPTASPAALILAVSQLSIRYAQHARMYTQLRFFVLCAVFFFFVALREKRAWAWWSCVGCVTLMIYTHYYGMLAAGILFAYALWRRKRDHIPTSWLIGGALVPLVSFTPWLLSGVVQQALQSPFVRPTSQASWYQTHWFTFFSTINLFNSGKFFGISGPSPWWIYLAGFVLFTVPALLALKPLLQGSALRASDHSDQGPLVFLAMLWLLPLTVIVSLGAAFATQYDVRYIFFCTMPYYLLVARGLAEVKSTYLRRAFLILVLAYSVVSLRSVYSIPYKENSRDALAYLAREYRPGDCSIVLPDRPSDDLWTTYLKPEWSIYQGDRALPTISNADAVASNPASCQGVWVISFHQVDDDAQEVAEGEQLLEKTLDKVREVSFFGVNLDLYAPRNNAASLR